MLADDVVDVDDDLVSPVCWLSAVSSVADDALDLVLGVDDELVTLAVDSVGDNLDNVNGNFDSLVVNLTGLAQLCQIFGKMITVN